jgi:multicomponent Na+:H+ antiporter subunit G
MPESGLSLLELWTMTRHALGAFLCLAGGLLCLIGAIGVIRFPDFYTRLQAASVTDTGGAWLVLLGMMLMAPSPWTFFEIALIFVVLFMTGPAASHALANAAHVAKLEPLIGPVKKSKPVSTGAGSEPRA